MKNRQVPVIVMQAMWVAVVAGVVLAVAGGCRRRADGMGRMDAQAATNKAMMRLIYDHARQNAAIADHTIHPYHFVPNATALNPLGLQHVADLAAAYRTAPGMVTLPRGDVRDDLHQARVQVVLERMADAGVDVQRLRIVEDPQPGDPRVSSARATRLLLQAEVGAGSGTSAGGGMSGAGASGAGNTGTTGR
ncbi:MAG TPA: hypothetical protein VGR35_09890 [Tepidisphaeraceae bacterium]|nr:hypothetical protein [Tepidisphaeraceae bacterium]